MHFFKKGLFFWLPIHQNFSNTVQVIAGKESHGGEMSGIDLLLVKFQNYQCATSLGDQLNHMETD